MLTSSAPNTVELRLKEGSLVLQVFGHKLDFQLEFAVHHNTDTALLESSNDLMASDYTRPARCQCCI